MLSCLFLGLKFGIIPDYAIEFVTVDLVLEFMGFKQIL